MLIPRFKKDKVDTYIIEDLISLFAKDLVYLRGCTAGLSAMSGRDEGLACFLVSIFIALSSKIARVLEYTLITLHFPRRPYYFTKTCSLIYHLHTVCSAFHF